MDKWTELRTAYQVAKLGTVSAAAEALGYHRATVNRHIDVLEAEIGARIFIRHARGYALTDVGEDMLRVAEKTESLIDDLAGRVQGGKAQIDGEIKLTILAPFAGILMPAVTAFRAENPQCTVVIDASEDLAKLEYGEAHIALQKVQSQTILTMSSTISEKLSLIFMPMKATLMNTVCPKVWTI